VVLDQMTAFAFSSQSCMVFMRASQAVDFVNLTAAFWERIAADIGTARLSRNDPDRFPFIRGDVIVIQLHKGGLQAGHVAGYGGRHWISDFVQIDFWAGPAYRNQKPRPSYAVYRY
jgi:hypothetical protein